jgi:hypothetical protein
VGFDIVGQALTTATFVGAFGQLSALRATLAAAAAAREGVAREGGPVGVGGNRAHQTRPTAATMGPGGGSMRDFPSGGVIPVAAAAALCSSLLSVPVEVVKQHVQARRYAPHR